MTGYFPLHGNDRRIGSVLYNVIELNDYVIKHAKTNINIHRNSIRLLPGKKRTEN